MTIFLESPMPAILIGIVLEAILGGFLVATRRGVLLAPIGGVLLLVIFAVLLERWVVTEREQVEDTLYAAAAAIESNDLERVQSFIANSPQSDVLRRASSYMGMVQFERISLHNVQVGKINKLTSPPTVEVKFDGTAHFQDRTGQIPYNQYPGSYEVKLVLEPGGWKVLDVRGDPQKPLQPGAN